jgi:ectonucleotide pyrophosphatase/phosphodiesterase family protein 5
MILVLNLKKLFLTIFVIFFSSIQFAQSQPYAILISFDAFRWDYSNRNITPNIESLVENGVKAQTFKPVFPSKTFPNHISIITGLYPEHHGIIFNDFYNIFTGAHFKTSDSVEVRDSRWYKGEAFWETARHQGIITASYFWPGSDVNSEYRRPNYYYHYKHSTPYAQRVKGVIDWLRLPYNKRPHFITLYFELADDIGHKYGPNSPQIDTAIATLDSTIGNLITSLSDIQMRDSVNIILVSDHGMTNISANRIVNVEEMLKGYKVRYSNSGPVMMIQPKQNELEEIYSILKRNEKHYKVYKKENIPNCYHFSQNPFIYKILLVADLGWSVITNKESKWYKPGSTGGNHGYDNNTLDMQGTFIASGPQFKKNYKTGTIRCIDVYPLLCRIFNVVPSGNIDGRLDRIKYIQKEH